MIYLVGTAGIATVLYVLLILISLEMARGAELKLMTTALLLSAMLVIMTWIRVTN